MDISNEIIESAAILAKLQLGDEEKKQIKKDMETMLEYFGRLPKPDENGGGADESEPSFGNVFREDEVTNGNAMDDMLANAPEKKDGTYVVPKSIG